MHCHFEVHTSWGLKMVFVVDNGKRPSETLIPPPKDRSSVADLRQDSKNGLCSMFVFVCNEFAYQGDIPVRLESETCYMESLNSGLKNSVYRKNKIQVSKRRILEHSFFFFFGTHLCGCLFMENFCTMWNTCWCSSTKKIQDCFIFFIIFLEFTLHAGAFILGIRVTLSSLELSNFDCRHFWTKAKHDER